MVEKYQILNLNMSLQLITINLQSNDVVDNNIKSKTLFHKSDISGFINNADLDKKKSSNISTKRCIKSKTRQNNNIRGI